MSAIRQPAVTSLFATAADLIRQARRRLEETGAGGRAAW